MPTEQLIRLPPGAVATVNVRRILRDSRRASGIRIRESIRAGKEAAEEQESALSMRSSTPAENRQAKEAMRRALIKGAKAFKAQADAIEALEARIESLEESASVVGDNMDNGISFLGLDGSQDGLRKLANIWMAYVNKDDTLTPANNTLLAAAVAIEQLGNNTPSESMALTLALLVRGYAYYDASLGLSSIFSAGTTAVAGTSTDGIASVTEILAYLLEQGEVDTIATIEAAIAAVEAAETA